MGYTYKTSLNNKAKLGKNEMLLCQICKNEKSDSRNANFKLHFAVWLLIFLLFYGHIPK